MRLKTICALVVLFAACVWCMLWRPSVLLVPVLTIMGLVQYPFLALYALCVEPVFGVLRSLHTHREYHQLLHDSYHERSKLLKELIDADAQLAYYKELYDAGIWYDAKSARSARIIYKQLRQADSFFIIDKGSSAGVTTDMVVILNNVVLGRVTAVFSHCARVMPVSNVQCHVPSVCARSHAHGVFRGDAHGYGQLDFISHLEHLVPDELVLTSGDGLVYPQGLALGTIRTCTLRESGFLYHIEVDPLYDLETVRYCCVVSKGMQDVLPALPEGSV